MDKFIELCKKKVRMYAEEHTKEKDFDVFAVWSCKTLQNMKALLSTDIPDGRYYECTYNGDKKELYFDAYKKEKNICFKVGDE